MSFYSNRSWQPIAGRERYGNLDVLRGMALFGVLLVNLLSDFRVSLSEHILHFHTQPGLANHIVDILAAGLLEFKAITLFSVLFGAGIAIFAERADANGVSPTCFLMRRLAILLIVGLVHLLLIWNGDILTLYAICGFLLLPLLRLSVRGLLLSAAAGIALSFVPWSFWPAETALHAMAVQAQRAYSTGTFLNVLTFHFAETKVLILPLLAGTLPKTLGLMALGAAVWRIGLFRNPDQHSGLLRSTAVAGGLIGTIATIMNVSSASTGKTAAVSPLLLEVGSFIPLSLAYGAALLLMLRSRRIAAVTAPFAAVGQMALTNYLSQSVLLSWLFYGYGWGLYGRLGSFHAALIGLAIYLGQMAVSVVWMRYCRFGPVEWLWRSLTYGRLQPMRRRDRNGPANA